MKEFQKTASPGKVLIEELNNGEILNKELEKEEKEEINKNYLTDIKDGVEIVDVKAIAKTKKRNKVDKYGIPTPETRKTWDKM